MEEKRELFWKQGDFGYVKDVTDSLVTICKQEVKVIELKWERVEGGGKERG